MRIITWENLKYFLAVVAFFGLCFLLEPMAKEDPSLYTLYSLLIIFSLISWVRAKKKENQGRKRIWKRLKRELDITKEVLTKKQEKTIEKQLREERELRELGVTNLEYLTDEQKKTLKNRLKEERTNQKVYRE